MRPIISDERGLTLIELCLTLLILGLIVAAASPRFAHSYRDLKLKLAAEGLGDDLLMLHRRAVLSGRTWRCTVWKNGQGYSLEQRVVQDGSNQSTWEQETEWQVKRNRRLPKSLTLSPNGVELEWPPDGTYPDHTLSVSAEHGKIYEIEIKKAKITVRPAETPEW